MHAYQRAIDLVAPYCDIVERMESLPPAARVRGLYLRTVETEMERRGKMAAYSELIPVRRRSWPLAWHPVNDYLVRLAVAGALIASPERLHEGIREIARANAMDFANSLLGRALIRLLARDPVRLSEQALAARRQTTNYGRWELIRHGATRIEMVYVNEYVWIESAIAYSAVGAFEACRLPVEAETTLVDRFNGSTMISW